MDSFHEVLRNVCKRPALYVGINDFRLASAFLDGYDSALEDLRPDLAGSGLFGFGKWLAVRLDSCARSGWSEIILREDTGADKFEALERLFDEFSRERSERGLEEVFAAFKLLDWGRDRTCWCELPPDQRDQWRPEYKRPSITPSDALPPAPRSSDDA
jgi:hypothetical protein